MKFVLSASDTVSTVSVYIEINIYICYIQKGNTKDAYSGSLLCIVLYFLFLLCT